VLAAALQTSPLKLLFPDALDHKIQALPGQPMLTSDAITRFVGDRGPLWPDAEARALADQLNVITRAISAGMAGHGDLRATAIRKEESQ
jgi:hypothetical protein